jgi:hypothetical protein
MMNLSTAKSCAMLHTRHVTMDARVKPAHDAELVELMVRPSW